MNLRRQNSGMMRKGRWVRKNTAVVGERESRSVSEWRTMSRHGQVMRRKLKKNIRERMEKGENKLKTREEITRKMSGIAEDRKEWQALTGTQPFQRDLQTRMVETNALYEMKASSKGEEPAPSLFPNAKKFFGSFDIPQFSAPLISEAKTTSSKYKQHRPCVSTMQLSFHKPIAHYKQITYSRDEQSCIKAQLPFGQKDK